jgi:predicted ester cyclase
MEKQIMTTEDLERNKALVRRAVAFNHGADDEAAEIFGAGFIGYMPGRPPMDRVTMDQFIGEFAGGFPGYTFEIQDQVAQGDIVFNRLTWKGVHRGEFAGVAATGRPIELSGINLFRVRDGRIVEQRAEIDFLGLLQQIGAIPEQ